MGSIRKRGKNYYLRWNEPGGVRREQVFHGSYAEARTQLRQFETEAAANAGPVRFRMTMDKAWDQFEVAHLIPSSRESTRKGYAVARKWWLNASAEGGAGFKDAKVYELKTEQIQRAMAKWAEEGRGEASTRRLMLLRLSGFFKWAVVHGYAGSNPCKDVTRPGSGNPVQRTLSPTDADRILEHLRKSGSRYYIHLYTLYWSGLRIGELRGLTWADFDKHGPSLRVWKSVYRNGSGAVKESGKPWSMTKTGRGERQVYIPRGLLQALQNWQVTGWYRDCPRLWGDGAADVLMFPSISGLPMHEQVLREALRDAAREVKGTQTAGGQGVGRIVPVGRDEFDPETLTLHHLRHGYARRMLHMGMTLPELQRQMGHANFVTTMQYANYARNDRPRLFDDMDQRQADLHEESRARRGSHAKRPETASDSEKGPSSN